MQPYASAYAAAFNKEIDWNSDTLKLTLHTSSYTPDRVAHDYVDDLTNELSTAGGYTSGGFTVANASVTKTAANSWGTAHATSTAYAVDKVVRPSTGNGFLYRCVVAGTSHTSAPTWPTVVGEVVVETGGVTWENVGRAIIVLTFDDVTQGSFTAGPFRYAVLSDRTPGTAATQPLIGLTDFVTDRTGGGGSMTYDVDAQGALHIFIP